MTSTPPSFIQPSQLDTLNVCFAANPGYYQHTCVTIVSILENNKDLKFAFHILTPDKTGKDTDKILSLPQKYPNAAVEFVPVDDTPFADLPVRTAYCTLSVQAYYRWLIPELFPHLDTALYLDSDIVCNGSLAELFAADIGDCYCAAVTDHYLDTKSLARKNIGLRKEERYINSGVLMMNLKKWRETQAVRDLKRWSKDNAAVNRYADQDALNACFQGQIKILDIRYNYLVIYQGIQGMLFFLSRYRMSKVGKPVIFHYPSGNKPWIETLWLGRLSPLYFKYLALSPYSTVAAECLPSYLKLIDFYAAYYVCKKDDRMAFLRDISRQITAADKELYHSKMLPLRVQVFLKTLPVRMFLKKSIGNLMARLVVRQG
ncbi:MAG: glycosyltransferase family 8 protein [Planctomycetaceae bacterium]|nr:glycosyltransferase family 8 protein [Planctomycetaceae bacterium]